MNNDLRYIKTPGLWVMWPFCPLKRFVGQTTRDFGYLVAQEGKLTTIYKGNVFMAKKDDPVGWTYESAEQLVADGWVVD